jgi:hypothetical protein
LDGVDEQTLLTATVSDVRGTASRAAGLATRHTRSIAPARITRVGVSPLHAMRHSRGGLAVSGRCLIRIIGSIRYIKRINLL